MQICTPKKPPLYGIMVRSRDKKLTQYSWWQNYELEGFLSREVNNFCGVMHTQERVKPVNILLLCVRVILKFLVAPTYTLWQWNLMDKSSMQHLPLVRHCS